MPFIADKTSTFIPDESTTSSFQPDEEKKPTVSGFAKQFGIGFGDEALLGYGLGAIKKTKGEEAVKELESSAPIERFGRGLGRTAGFLTPLPTKIFKVGQIGKTALQAYKGTKEGKKLVQAIKGSVGVAQADKLFKFAESAATSAIGVGAYEAVRAPKESVKEKITTVPTAALFGGALGLIGESISQPINRFLKSRNLSDKGLVADTPELKKLLDKTDDASKNSRESVFVKIREIAGKLEKEAVDRFSPIRHLVEQAEQVTGKKVSAFDNPNFQVSRYLGTGQISNKRVEDLFNVIKPVYRERKILFDVMKLQRFAERAEKGFSNPRGFTLQESNKALNDIRNQVGDDLFNRLISTGQSIRDKVYTPLLNDLTDILGKDNINKILQENEFYTRFDIVNYLAENLDKIPRGSKSLASGLPGALKSTQGTENEIADIGDSMINYIHSMTRFSEGQKVLHKIVGLRNYGQAMDDIIKPVVGDIPKGFSKINLVKNGIKEEYAVPDYLADSIKGLNAQTADTVSRMVGFINNSLKLGATTYNAAFSARNIFRDYQQAKVTSGIGLNVADLLKGFSESISKGKYLDLYLREGGGLSGPQSFYTNKLIGSFDELYPSLSKKVLKAFNPETYLNKIATISENTTRTGIFKRAINRGLPMAEAIHIARNSTIDFNRMGTTMAIANLWIPFLAARTKGSYNVLRAAVKNPKNFAVNAVPIIVAPAMYTYLHNVMNYPDVWNDIPPFEKQNNFIFIHGREKVLEDGVYKYTDVVEIPKGDIGKIIANPIENFMDFLNKKEGFGFVQTASQILSDISPIPFMEEGKLSGKVISSTVIPPPMKAIVEATTNRNLFTGREIIKEQRLKQASPREQYTEKTPAIAVAIGDVLNISPMIVENTIGTMLGSAGRQVLDPSRVGRGINDAFLTAYAGEEQNRMFDVLQEVKMDYSDTKARELRFLKQSLEDYKKIIPAPDVRRQFVNNRFREQPKLLEKFVDLIEAESKGEMPIHRSLRHSTIKERIDFIKRYSNTMRTPEEKMFFLQDLLKNKVISIESFKKAE